MRFEGNLITQNMRLRRSVTGSHSDPGVSLLWYIGCDDVLSGISIRIPRDDRRRPADVSLRSQ